MARNLNEKADSGSLAADGGTDTKLPRKRRRGLLETVVADAYNISIAVAMLTAAYWALLRDVPFGMTTFALLFAALLTIDVLATLR